MPPGNSDNWHRSLRRALWHIQYNSLQYKKQGAYTNMQLGTYTKNSFLHILQGIVLNISNSFELPDKFMQWPLSFKVHSFSKWERTNIFALCPCKYPSSQRYQFSAVLILPTYTAKQLVTNKVLMKHPPSKIRFLQTEP